MTIDPQIIRSERHLEIGRLIQEGGEDIVARWARRAVEEQPHAARAHEQELRNHLPVLLHTLAISLADLTSPDAVPHRASAAEHGEQRWQAGWSLREVVRDYQILRLVIFDYLEEKLARPLLLREVQAVGLALDEAIAASVAAYAQHRDEHQRRLEAERAERQRQAEETQLRWDRVFQNAGWGIALIRPGDDTLEVVNPAFARLHGCTPQEMAGRRLAEAVAPEGRADLSGHLERADREGQWDYESEHVRRDGTRFPVLAHLTTIRDRAGTPLYRALNLQDVTGAKQTEQSLRDQAAALREADRRKTEFLGVLGHELRNPLAPILSSVQVLRLLGTSDAAVAEACDIVERQARQMARLVDDLLDATRIAQGKLELRRGTFDLTEAVHQAVQQAAPLFASQGHEFTLDLPPGPLPVEADRDRVVQVLVNLMNNAAKYTERGGTIELSVAAEDHEVVLRVCDNGVGIEPAMLGRVFDLFIQVDRSLDRARGGLGIGLTLVRHLVELHGGRVSAHSDGPGKGSEFVVRLPATPCPADTGQAPAAPTPRAALRVLVVEDNADACATLALLLRLLGHEVEVARTGPEGVERGLTTRPRLALIDLGLPQLDGYEVARKLRAEVGKQAVLVALTGHASEEDRRRALEAGFDAHLAKPVELEQLKSLLAQAASRRG
jgi:PAS domain S-box-containing protein